MEGPIYGGYQSTEQDMDVRKGPWTVEEDSLLTEYVAVHGEGRWNAAARCAGLKRTGKSCRLRWLNYLCPNVRRGNISLQEQLLILELHSRWGNRWSKIAEYLPGRTDNEIKNYWRTRVQKLAKQLKCDVNSKQFKDAMRSVWMPRLMEQINASSSKSSSLDQPANNENVDFATCYQSNQIIGPNMQEISENSGFSISERVNSGTISNFSPESFDTQVSLVLDTTDYPNSFQPSWNHPDILRTGPGSYPMGTELGYLDSWSVFGGEDSSAIFESWWVDSEHEKSIWDL